MQNYLKAFTSKTLWRKFTAWMGIFAIVSTMVMTMPLPTAQAAPTKVGDAVYTANNGNGKSLIAATFNEPLDINAGKVACPGGTPFTNCYDVSSFVLGGSGWETSPAPTIAVAARNEGMDNQMFIVFSAADAVVAIGNGPTITIPSGVAGVTAPQAFNIAAPPPPLPTAAYLAVNVGAGDKSTLTFGPTVSDITNFAEVACGDYTGIAGVPGNVATCFDPAVGLTFTGQEGVAWDATSVPTAIFVDPANAKLLTIIFSKGNSANLGANPAPQIKLDGFGGFVNATYGLVVPAPPAPVKQGDATYTDNIGGSSVIQAMFNIPLNAGIGTEACSEGSPFVTCFDKTKVVEGGGGWDGGAEGAVIVDVGLDTINNTVLGVHYLGTAVITDLQASPTLTFNSGIAGIVENQVFDVVAAAPPLSNATYLAMDATAGNKSTFTITYPTNITEDSKEANCDAYTGIAGVPGNATICFDPAGKATELGGGWLGGSVPTAIFVDPTNAKKLVLIYNQADTVNLQGDPTPQLKLNGFGGFINVTFNLVAADPPPAPQGPTISSITCKQGADVNGDGGTDCAISGGGELADYFDGDIATGKALDGASTNVVFELTLSAPSAIYAATINQHADGSGGGNWIKSGKVWVYDTVAEDWIQVGATMEGLPNQQNITAKGDPTVKPYSGTKVRIMSSGSQTPGAQWWPTEFSVRAQAPTAISGNVLYYPNETNSYIRMDLDEPLSMTSKLESCPGTNAPGSICYPNGKVTVAGTNSASIVKVINPGDKPGNRLVVIFDKAAVFNNFDSAEISMDDFGSIKDGPITSTDFANAPPEVKVKAEYTASAQGLNKSIIITSFTTALDGGSANDSYCTDLVEVLPGGFKCYNPASVSLVNTEAFVEGTSVLYVFRNGDNPGEGSEDPTEVQVILDRENAIVNFAAVPKITLSAFGGIASPQTFTIAAPVGDDDDDDDGGSPQMDGGGEYIASENYFQGNSVIALPFNPGPTNDGDNPANCPGLGEAELGDVKCYDSTKVTFGGGGFAGGTNVAGVLRIPSDLGYIWVVFNNANVVNDLNDITMTAKAGIAGITEDQVFNSFTVMEGGGDDDDDDDGGGGGPMFIDAWMDGETTAVVEFSESVTQQQIDGVTFSLKIDEQTTIEADSATVDGQVTTDVAVVFTTALSNEGLSKIMPGPDGYFITYTGLGSFMPIQADFNDEGGWFGPPVVINEVNTFPKQDWSSAGSGFDAIANAEPGGVASITAGAENDQYIELRINNGTPGGWPDFVKEGGVLDLTKIRLTVYDRDWNLVAACNLGAGPACATVGGEEKFSNVYYKGSGSFGTPSAGDLIVFANPGAALPVDDLRIELSSYGGEYPMFLSDLAMGNMNNNSSWNAPPPNNGGQAIALNIEAVGLDDKGSDTGAWERDYARQTATPQKVNAYQAKLDVMGVFPCGPNRLCVDFTKAVDTDKIKPANFAIYEAGTFGTAQQAVGTCMTGPCGISDTYREGGGGRFMSITLDDNMIPGKPYDLYILGGANGVSDTDGAQLSAAENLRGFEGHMVDTTAPVYLSTNVRNENEIELMFDEFNGLDASNVTITSNLTVSSKWAEWDRLIIQFSQDMQAQDYELTINNLKDMNGNTADPITVSFGGFDTGSFENNAPPSVLEVSPSDGAQVATNLSNYQLTFNEAIDDDSIIDANFKLRKVNESTWESTQVDIGSDYLTYNSDTNTVSMAIQADALSANSLYEVEVSEVSDYTNNQYWGNFYFYTTGEADEDKPNANYSTIDDNLASVSTGVGIITVFFDEAMAPATIEDSNPTQATDNITLTTSSSGSTTYISGTVYYDPGSYAAEFHISETLNPNTQYTLSMSTDLTDASGNALSSAFTRTFTTADSDSSGPELHFAEFNGWSVWMQFSESMGTSSSQNVNNYTFMFNGDEYTDTGGLTAEYFPWDNAVEVRGFQGVSMDDSFEVEISTNVKDASGNSMDASNRSASGSGYDPGQFEKEAMVMEASPRWGEWDVNRTIQTVSAFFDIPLDSSTVSATSVKLYKGGNQNANLCSSVEYRSASNGVICTINGTLDANMGYQFQVGLESFDSNYSSSIKDENGNLLAWPEYIDFQTGSDSDSEAPTVDVGSVYPNNASTNLPVGLPFITIGFDESMDSTTFTNSSVSVYPTANESDTVFGKREYYPSWNGLEFLPSEPLEANTAYTIKVTTDATDSSGNALAQNFTSVFTTGAADAAPPVLEFVNATNWDLGIRFSEAVDQDTLTTKNFKVYVKDGAGEYTNNKSLEGKELEYFEFDQMFFIRGFNFQAGDDIKVVATNVKDLSGNTIEVGVNNNKLASIMDMTYQDNAPEVWSGFPQGWDEPVNTPYAAIEFSKAMAPLTIDETTFKIYPHICSGWSCNDGAAISASSYTYDDNTNTVFFNFASDLIADQEYHVVVTTGITDANGNNLRSWDMFNKGSNDAPPAYDFFFHTSSNSQGDTSSAEIWGTSLDMYYNWNSNQPEDVPITMWGIDIPFSKQMDSSTIRDLNASDSGSNISVVNTETEVKVQGSVEYNQGSQSAVWKPEEAFAPNKIYELRITTGVQDLTGNSVNTYTQSFTTENVAADTDGPKVTYAEADTYGITIYFDEPVDKDLAETVNNYTIYTCDPSAAPTLEDCLGDSAYLQPVSLKTVDGLSMHYEEWDQAINIDGLTLAENNIVQVTVSGIEDFSGNDIDTGLDNNLGRSVDTNKDQYNVYEFYVMTFYDDYFAFDNWTDDQKMFNNFVSASVHPENRMAGASTTLYVDFPINEKIDDGGEIRLKFPRGFDVSLVEAVPTFSSGGTGKMSSVNEDINGPGSETVAIDSVTVNETTRTVSILIDGATETQDFITLDLYKSVNPSTPGDYTINLETYGSDGKMLESIEAEQIYVEPMGSGKVTVQVTAEGGGNPENGSSVSVHLNSMSGAHFEETATFNGNLTTAVATFNGLQSNDYDVFIDPYQKLGNDEYFGNGGDFIYLQDGETRNVELSIYAADADTIGGETRQTLTVTGSGGPANEKVDLHIWSWNDFYEKEASFNAFGNLSEEIKVTEGHYTVAIDPWMPKGYFMGPPPAMTFMPPQPKDVKVNGEGGEVDFSFNKMQNKVKVTVLNEDDQPIPDAQVYLSPLSFGSDGSMGGGIGGETGNSGEKTLDITPGWYEVSVQKAGLPQIPRQDVIVTTDHDGDNPAEVSFTVKVPSIKVTGKVTKNGNPVANAPVYGNAVSTGEWLDTVTDANGKYQFYSDASTTWQINAWVTGFGEASKVVNVGTTNLTSQNINLLETSFVPVNGILKYGSGEGTVLANTSVFGRSTSGTDEYFNEVHTNSEGIFAMRLPAGEYELGVFSAELGSKVFMEDLDISDGEMEDLGEVFVTSTDSAEVTIKLVDTAGQPYTPDEAFIDISSTTTGAASFMEMRGVSEKTMKLEAGSGYTTYVNVAESGALPARENITVSDGSTLTFTVRDKATASGQVLNGGSQVVENAKITFIDSLSDFSREVITDSSGEYSLDLPVNRAYQVKVKKKGYLPYTTEATVGTGTVAIGDISIEAEDNSVGITGTITAGGDATNANARVVFSDDTGRDRTLVVDENGDFDMKLTPGEWTVKAYKDGFETTTPVAVTVTDDIEQADIDLSAIAGYTVSAPSVSTIVPANGGVINYNGVTITIPANAIDSSSQTYRVAAKITSEVMDTGIADPASDTALELNITDNNGIAVTTLSKPIQIEQDFSGQDLDEGASCGSFSSSQDANWETITCRQSGDNMIFSTNHLTIFGAIDWSDDVAPSAPAGLSAIANTGYIALDWANNSEGDLLEYLVYRGTSSGFTADNDSQINTVQVTGSAYNDTTVTEGTTYYYKVSAVDSSGNTSSASTERSATAAGGDDDDDDDVVDITPENIVIGGGNTDTYPWSDNDDDNDDNDDVVTITMDLSDYDYVGHWAQNYIDSVITNGIASGKGENEFAPDLTITRAELTKMVLLAAEHDVDMSIKKTSFTDVSVDDWFAPYVEAAKDAGIVEGYEDGTFKPNEAINRAEALKILIEGGLGKSIILDESRSVLANFGLSTNPFPDVDMSAWYTKYVFYAYTHDIVGGYADGTFGAGNSMTRAEFSKVLVVGMEL